MDEWLGNIYCFFDSLFGHQLAEFLWGYNCMEENYANPNLFNRVGLACIAISFILSLIYYYALNLVRSERLWWTIFWIGNGFINFAIGTYITLSAFNDDTIGDCMLYQRDDAGEVVNHLIQSSDCYMFGVANFIIALMLFFLFSMMMKWGSRTCKYYPF
jgi:hypothetical protein